MLKTRPRKARTTGRERTSKAHRNGSSGEKHMKTENETAQSVKSAAASKAQDAGAKPYEPTSAEAETLKAYRAARAKRGPRLKVSGSDVSIDDGFGGTQCRCSEERPRCVINASAVAIFVFSKDVHWLQALITAIGASFGGWAGALMLRRVNEKLLKLAVVALGVALTIGLFWI
jgi:hypothetical protein